MPPKKRTQHGAANSASHKTASSNAGIENSIAAVAKTNEGRSRITI